MASTRIVEHIGRVLGGRYRLLAPIGTGASAHVFLAEDVSLRRRVAVKVLHPALAEDAPFLRRFRAEAQAAAALNHPNIMAVYDWGEEPESPYLVCELLGGGSLRAMLDRGHRLSPTQALLVGLEAARALDYAHRRGLVHRDIKPANLLFGDDARLRVADFGLARALAEAAWTEPAGAVLGTARYACPEQVRGSSVDGRADVYSLAVVLVEAVTGEVPFAADTTLGTLMARVDRPLPVPEELGPLAPVLERAGRTDPEERPDAGALARALEGVAGQLPPPAPLPLAGTPVVEEETGAEADDFTEIGFTRPPAEPPPAPTPAETTAPLLSPAAARRRRRWPLLLATVLVALVLAAGIAYAVVQAAIPTHPVPDQRNRTEAEAVPALRQLNFRVQVRHRFVDGTEPGQVTAQNPDGGRLKEGGVVTLTVSRGPTPVDVPDLTGLSRAGAQEALERAGLRVGEVRPRPDEQVPADQVLNWDGKGEQRPRGSAVNLEVSSGPAPRTIPELSGRNYDQAAADLRAKGLAPVRGEAFSDTVPKDKVIGTTPRAGASVERGSRVTVVVSKGPDVVELPDVRGATVAEARAKLEAAGLKAVVFGPPSARRVFFSLPAAGTQVKRGSEVSVYAA